MKSYKTRQCWKRLKQQSDSLFKTIPKYNEKTLKQISRTVTYVWNERDHMSYNAITMLNVALCLVEICREGAETAHTPARLVWQRMTGTLNTIMMHVDSPYWENPDEYEQAMGMALAYRVIRRIHG